MKVNSGRWNPFLRDAEMTEKEVFLELGGGIRLHHAVAFAVMVAQVEKKDVCFKFNEVQITVCEDTEVSLVQRDYHRACNLGTIEKAIGPHYSPDLPAEECQYDADVEVARERVYGELRNTIFAKPGMPDEA